MPIDPGPSDDAQGIDFRRDYDNSPCGFLTTTPQGLIRNVNQTFLAWTGFTREALVGSRTFVQLLSPGGRLFHETHYAPLLQIQGWVREIALDVVCANGQRLPVLVNANLDRDEAGSPVAVRIALFDATERREYERELVRAKDRAEASEQRARELARTLQLSLIPPSLPQIDGLEVAGDFRAAAEDVDVGGDFYDVFAISADEWIVALGDVCGKGVEAAGLTALARHTIRAVAVGLHTPSAALAALNEVLLGHESDRFCTVAMIRMRREGDSWRVVLGSGGHPPAVLVRPGDPPVMVGGSGPLLGVIEEPDFEDHQLLLAPGDALVLYTDGVTEGRRGDEFFDEDRLLESVDRNRSSAFAIVDGLVREVGDFQDGHLRDDVAVVAVGVRG
ncbi:PP2C family protein-serine/threonine phosphatase [Nocardioides sp.]|uniref:PP2C family protein-serine/threonine phosphatase n=1 Tax=Nocardioides sp. TaxID=35761 RepID=UPI0035693F1F